MQRFIDTYKRAKEWYFTYERYLIPGALLCGFTIDWFTLQRIDTPIANVFLATYIVTVALGILFINLYDEKYALDETAEAEEGTQSMLAKIAAWVRLVAPLGIQFAFGGLFSVFVVFYSRSGSFSVSWLFMLILVGLMIGNEAFKKHYENLSFQTSILFFTLFSFTIFYVPIVVGKIGLTVFLLSGAVSLFIIVLFLWVLSRLTPQRFSASRVSTISGIVAIFVTINLLYFSNIIPPIPLSLKAGDAVHRVERLSESSYVVSDQQQSWQNRWYKNVLGVFKSDEIHLVPGEPVYFWSSVFAPTDLNTQIVHHWQYHNPDTDQWESASRIAFPVSGGRADGYRGYSLKRNVSPGQWRVDVETVRGQVIGRRTFRVSLVDSPNERPPVVESVR